MALTAGIRVGPCEIAAQIGVGGMGEVYRATDTRLKRAVGSRTRHRAGDLGQLKGITETQAEDTKMSSSARASISLP